MASAKLYIIALCFYPPLDTKNAILYQELLSKRNHDAAPPSPRISAPLVSIKRKRTDSSVHCRGNGHIIFWQDNSENPN